MYIRPHCFCGLFLITICGFSTVGFAVDQENTEPGMSSASKIPAAGKKLAIGIVGLFALYRLYPFLIKPFCGSGVKGLLGFDPQIRIPPPVHPDQVVCLSQQGFGCSDSAHCYDGADDAVLSVTCNPRDTFGVYTNWRHVNFGQQEDALVVLYALQQAKDAGHSRINLFGHSRGGASIIRALYALSNAAQKSGLCQELGILQDEAKALLSLVQVVCLANPWLDTNHPFEVIGRILSSAIIPERMQGLSTALVVTVVRLFLATTTNFSLRKASAFDDLKALVDDNERKYAIAVDLAEDDEVVGNRFDKALFEHCATKKNVFINCNENKLGDLAKSHNSNGYLFSAFWEYMYSVGAPALAVEH